jgi:hypothetical protein
MILLLPFLWGVGESARACVCGSVCVCVCFCVRVAVLRPCTPRKRAVCSIAQLNVRCVSEPFCKLFRLILLSFTLCYSLPGWKVSCWWLSLGTRFLYTSRKLYIQTSLACTMLMLSKSCLSILFAPKQSKRAYHSARFGFSTFSLLPRKSIQDHFCHSNTFAFNYQWPALGAAPYT